MFWNDSLTSEIRVDSTPLEWRPYPQRRSGTERPLKEALIVNKLYPYIIITILGYYHVSIYIIIIMSFTHIHICIYILCGYTFMGLYPKKKHDFLPRVGTTDSSSNSLTFATRFRPARSMSPALRGAEKSQCYGKWKVTIVVNNGFGMVNKSSVMVNNG